MRARHGLWRLRIDDIDTPRNQAGASDRTLATLDAYALHWDGPVYYQSQHLEDYEQALARLRQQDQLYPCICSRKTLAELPGRHDVYPGLCRNLKALPAGRPYALRIRSRDLDVVFDDRAQGVIRQNLAAEHGDFILKRKEGIVSYQLACVIDDDFQGINAVVRGFDLVDSTPKQIYLQQLLGLPTPSYLHVPIIVDSQGYKLSKQTLAEAVSPQHAPAVTFKLLQLLGQQPPPALQGASCAELLAWGVTHTRQLSKITLPLFYKKCCFKTKMEAKKSKFCTNIIPACIFCSMA